MNNSNSFNMGEVSYLRDIWSLWPRTSCFWTRLCSMVPGVAFPGDISGKARDGYQKDQISADAGGGSVPSPVQPVILAVRWWCLRFHPTGLFNSWHLQSLTAYEFPSDRNITWCLEPPLSLHPQGKKISQLHYSATMVSDSSNGPVQRSTDSSAVPEPATHSAAAACVLSNLQVKVRKEYAPVE